MKILVFSCRLVTPDGIYNHPATGNIDPLPKKCRNHFGFLMVMYITLVVAIFTQSSKHFHPGLKKVKHGKQSVHMSGKLGKRKYARPKSQVERRVKPLQFSSKRIDMRAHITPKKRQGEWSLRGRLRVEYTLTTEWSNRSIKFSLKY